MNVMTKLQFEAFKKTEEYKQLQESMDIDQDVIQVMKNVYETTANYGKEIDQVGNKQKYHLMNFRLHSRNFKY